MYLAMNRFSIKVGFEGDFEALWRDRDSYLDQVPGFKVFHLMRGATDANAGTTLFATHTTWESEEAFRAWTASEHFRLAHKNAGGNRDLYADRPKFEGFVPVVSEGLNP